VPPDTDGALIQTSNPESGTAQVVSGLSELYADESSDFQVLNLETPVLNNPATPHTAKDHAFFTLPGSLTPLKQMGLDYVSLGNNHVYAVVHNVKTPPRAKAKLKSKLSL
jgi:hypothetical protein